MVMFLSVRPVSGTADSPAFPGVSACRPPRRTPECRGVLQSFSQEVPGRRFGSLPQRCYAAGMTDLAPPPFEVQKWAHEMKREDAYRAFDLFDSRFDIIDQAAIKAADSALRAGLLINGGAAVSVLAFIGSLATKELIAVSQLSHVATALKYSPSESPPQSWVLGCPISRTSLKLLLGLH